MQALNRLALLQIIILLLASPGARAQSELPDKGDLMPAISADTTINPSETLDRETHPPLKLSPDKSELVRLDREAGSVVVGNPNHVAVLLDTPRLAVVIPREPGATSFTILDREGNVIMQRHAVVASPKKNYIRVRRSCANVPDGTDCQPTSVYFCPDICHEIDGSAEEPDQAQP